MLTGRSSKACGWNGDKQDTRTFKMPVLPAAWSVRGDDVIASMTSLEFSALFLWTRRAVSRRRNPVEEALFVAAAPFAALVGAGTSHCLLQGQVLLLFVW